MADAGERAGLSQVGGRPGLTAAAAAELLRAGWQITGQVSRLPSERDQNWLVSRGDRREFVLKIANGSDDTSIVDLQQQLMRRLAGAGIPCPQVVASSSGADYLKTSDGLAWLITVLPGDTLAATRQRSPRLLHDLGRLLGAAQTALAGFDHPAAHRHIQWDVLNAAEVLDAYRGCVTDRHRRDVLGRATRRFERRVRPVLPDLPRATIHNDANDHNVLVTGDRVTGLIDFGDAVHTVRVNELAVACAYAMFDAPDPGAVLSSVASGFRTRATLERIEEQCVPDLVITRLAMSVSISAHQRALAPADGYLHVSEAPAWRLLADLTMDE
jgi:Ser/Thr protein kinase RdoA (MazF antagonist)